MRLYLGFILVCSTNCRNPHSTVGVSLLWIKLFFWNMPFSGMLYKLTFIPIWFNKQTFFKLLSDGKKLDWEKVLKLLDHSDFEKLFNHGFYSEDILLGSYRLMPQLFHITLSNLFQELKKGESSARPVRP